jgi:phenylacetate-CoA ligase
MNHKLPRGYKSSSFLERKLKENPESNWLRNGKRRAIRQFKSMAEDVPAYKKFLSKKGISASDAAQISNLNQIPSISKDSYLKKFERSELCWDGVFSEEPWVISTTSGSSGKPYYFPRTSLQDEYLTITTEVYLKSNFNIQDKTTLYINAFPMGAWIGGVFTYESIKQISEKGYSISIISPGVHKQEIINSILQLGEDFDQVIIGAYAPFLKDILDDGASQGVHWESYNVGFVFSAEAFTETFRDYVNSVIEPKNPLKSTLNHYGTVDLGTMAHETPLSILIRRLLVSDKKLGLIFPEINRQPTFAQFNPEMFYFESVKNNLFCTSFSGLPLVKYDLKDYGGVITKKEVYRIMSENGYDLDKLIDDAGIRDTVWNLPFVYVYERNDFSVSYYAFLVYPDSIRRALQTEKLMKLITGKFSMSVDYDKSGHQVLNIQIERSLGQKFEPELVNVIHDALLSDSSEYRETFKVVGDAIKPKITYWQYGDERYFKSGAKQKWVKK